MFKKNGAQITSTEPIIEISKTLKFSTSSLTGIERVLVFVFPLNAKAAGVLREYEFADFATTSFGEEIP